MKRNFTILFALVLALSLVMLPVGVVQAANLCAYYNTGDDMWTGGLWGDGLVAQTFTPESDCSVTSVKLQLRRTGLPGTIIVSINATDSNGHPTGPALTLGTTDGDTIPTTSPGEWREITLTSYDLTGGTKYAIVVRAPSGNLTPPNVIHWRYDSAGAYDGGNAEGSLNNGATWSTYTDIDMMFEVWGEGPVEVGGEVYPVNKLSVLAPWIALVAVIIPIATIVIRRRRAQS